MVSPSTHNDNLSHHICKVKNQLSTLSLSFCLSFFLHLTYAYFSLLYADTNFNCLDDQKGTLVSLYYDNETKIKSYMAGSQSVVVYSVIIFVVGLTGMLFLMVIVLLISYANRWNRKFNSEQGEE